MCSDGKIFWVFETASEVLAGGSGANSVSGVGDDTATNPGKGKESRLGREATVKTLKSYFRNKKQKPAMEPGSSIAGFCAF